MIGEVGEVVLWYVTLFRKDLYFRATASFIIWSTWVHIIGIST